MSTKYKDFSKAPNDVLVNRLKELSKALVARMHGDKDHFESEFTCRISFELDRDADVVLNEAAKRLRKLK